MRAQLIPLDGGPPIEILKDLLVVGRKEECDVRLEHKSVSKMHCVIVKTDGLLLLRDLGSTNGTRVNGQRVRRAALLPNDQLSIAHCQFRVYLGPDDAIPPAPARDERTQHLDADEVAKLLRQPKKPQGMIESEADIDLPPMPRGANPLPDVYPESDARDL